MVQAALSDRGEGREVKNSSGSIGSTRTGAMLVFVILLAGSLTLPAQQSSPARQMAQTTITRWPQGRFTPSGAPWRWNYELGTLLDGMDAIWYNTADGKYYQYVKQSVDAFVTADGSVATYDPKAYSLDNVLLGRQLLLLYRVTQDKRYYQAAAMLHQQLTAQPKNASGGFWHKQIYPDQMWLDGLYMAEPFFAEYASVFDQPQDFAKITRQFVLIEQHTRDRKTGLLYHGWDESKRQSWANKKTGDSANFWARGMGWYMMALVDALPYYPENDPGRARLLAILDRTAATVTRYQDGRTGLWYQVLDKPGEKGNYFESSAACMFTYALARGVRLGYLPPQYAVNARRAWQGIQQHFLQSGPDGALTLTGTVQGIGLGGLQHHDGSYAYYVSSPVVSNDPKGIGAFLLAGSEMEIAGIAQSGAHQKVLLDAWFNSQKRKNAAGKTDYFHYKWTDCSNSGFSLFGHIFRSYGIATDTLYTAPTLTNLKGAQYYIIVSPDNLARNPIPHYMTEMDAKQIAAWVKQGGILLLMENDPDNADIVHLDLLADKFGLHFNNALTHHVIGNDFSMGRIEVAGGGALFRRSYLLYMKDTSSLALTKDALPLLTYKGDTLMAYAKYGQGAVYAVADPWLYNEYTDGRKLPPEYDNFDAGMRLVRWLLQLRGLHAQ
jgi:unsaturated rhamnogalacturonyl hydrolase